MAFKMTYLQERKGHWIFRRAVPPDVRKIVGKREWKKALGRDRAEAVRLAHEEAARTDQVIESARNGTVPDAELERIAAETFHERVAEHEKWLRDHPDYDPEAVEIWLDDDLEPWTLGLRDNEWLSNKVNQTISDILANHGVYVSPSSRTFANARRIIGRAIASANRTALARTKNDYAFNIGDPLFQPVAAHPTVTAIASAPNGRSNATDGGLKLSELLERWIDERKPIARTRSEWERTVKRWTELFGDSAVASITRAQVGKFKDAMSQMPNRPPHAILRLPLPKLIEEAKARKLPRISGEAVNKSLTAIRSLMSYAQKNGIRDDNPATGIAALVDRKKKKRPFTPDELVRVLRASWREKEAHNRWLPVLAAFTGARRNEIALAKAADVKTDDGVAYLNITDEGDRRRLKTEASRRKIPLHPILRDLGFLDYVRDLDPDGPLLPEVDPERFTKDFRLMLDRIGISDRSVSFHSLRHGFEDAGRAAATPEDVRDALAGHAGGGIGRWYGLGPPLPILAEAIEKISYPGVTLAAITGKAGK